LKNNNKPVKPNKFIINTYYYSIINTNPTVPLVQIVEQIAAGKLLASKTSCKTLHI